MQVYFLVELEKGNPNKWELIHCAIPYVCTIQKANILIWKIIYDTNIEPAYH
jgi:hypothetical protein